MKLIYAPQDPADGERVEYDFDPDRVRQSEAEAAQLHYEGTWAQLRQGVERGDVRAMRVLLWMLMRRNKIYAGLKYKDSPDFYTGEVEVVRTVAELVEIRDRMASTPDLDERLLQASLALANEEIRKAQILEGIDPDADVTAGDPAPGTEGGHRNLTKGERAAGIDPKAPPTSPDTELSASSGGQPLPNSGESDPGNFPI